MKKILFLLALSFTGVTLLAQEEGFFPAKEGTVLQYEFYSQKDKLESTLKYTIKKVVENDGTLHIGYLSEAFSADKKPKTLDKKEITISRDNEKIVFDLSDYIYMEDITNITPALTSTIGGGTSTSSRRVGTGTVTTSVTSAKKNVVLQKGKFPDKATITGGKMEMPINLQIGDTLPDTEMNVKIKGSMKSSFINQEYVVRILNRKVETVEEITVKAGAFTCYVLTCDIDMRNVTKVRADMTPNEFTALKTYWYAKDVGIVKVEETNAGGELLSYTELTEINTP